LPQVDKAVYTAQMPEPSLSDPNPSARERILSAAHELFYRDGIRATGVDRLIAESSVAKLTFYRHFASKDALVRAFLAYRHERWMAWFIDALGRHGARIGGGMAPLALALQEWFSQPGFRGCAFINTVAELGGSQADVLTLAHQHKADMQAVIAALLPKSRQREAHWALWVDGLIVRAQMDPAAHLPGWVARQMPSEATKKARSPARREFPQSICS
jgi:AcrR family transcriptional regulator